ncbi:methyltransferase domain-containing protein [soil metagenome]
MKASDWNGQVGDVWAAGWRRTDRTCAGLAPQLEAAILDTAPAPNARIVDIGCGAGATSLGLAAALPDARITGIDISPGLIEVAKQRAAGLPRVDFVAAPLESEVAGCAPVDLFVSRHGVMFFDDPVVAFTALRAAAAPGARLVFSCFRPAALNPWASEIAAAALGGPPPPPAGYVPGPFAFANVDFPGSILAATGWVDSAYKPGDFTYRAGEGVDPVADAVDLFTCIGPAAAMLRAASPGDRTAMLDRVAAVVARYRSGDAVDFPAAAWLWSAKAG